VQTDLITKGNWKSVYGNEGYDVALDTAVYPAYVNATPGAVMPYVWTGSTSDARALQKVASATDRLASCWYSDSSFTVDLNFTDGQTHQVAFYFLDWEAAGRSAQVQILDANNIVLDTESLDSFSNGAYLVWQLGGRVKLQVTSGGGNAVLSGLFFGASSWNNSSRSVSSLQCNPSTLGPNASSTCTVTVTKPAGPGGAVVNLSSTGLAGVTLPASVTVPANATTASITISTGPLGTSQTGSLAASLGGVSQSVNINLVSGTGTATFVQTDLVTKGNWKSVYGSEGYDVFQDSSVYPGYVKTTPGAVLPYTWTASTTDARALQKAGSTDRIAGAWYSDSSFTVDLNFTDGQTHQVAFYLLDWDGGGRSAKVQILDAANLVLDTQNLASFTNGAYLVWKLSGQVKLKVTSVGAANAVMSGMFFGVGSWNSGTFVSSLQCNPSTLGPNASSTCTVTLTKPAGPGGVVVSLNSTGLSGVTIPASVTVPANATQASFTITTGPLGALGISLIGSVTASLSGVSQSVNINVVAATGTVSFVQTDLTTKGNWKSVYGSEGYDVFQDSAAYPSYLQTAPAAVAMHTWAASTTDVRGLQKAASNTDRIAGSWYSGSSFTVDLNFTDGQTHQAAFYFVDWDNNGRGVKVQILDAGNTVMDTQNLSNFGGGAYLVWKLSGQLKLRVTNTGVSNAVMSGMFFGAAGWNNNTFVSSLECPATLGVNAGGTCTVRLTKAAGAAGAVVSLSKTGLPGLTVPASVTVPANSATGSFTISTAAIGANQSGSVTASLGGLSQSANVSLVSATGGATFVQTDLITKGNWKSVYGSEGYDVFLDASAYPSYVTTAPAPIVPYVWAGSTADVRGLQKAASSTDRIAAAWYNDGSFAVDLNFTDGQTHQVAFYFLDWDNNGRSAKVQILDAANIVLDTQNLAGFANGAYLVWKLNGRVKVQVTRTGGGGNAVLSGMFFGAASWNSSTFLSSLQCNPVILGANAGGTCTVTLTKPAGPGGAAVSLSSTGLAGLTVPASVTVPANSTAATFPISTGVLGANQNGSLTATLSGISKSVNLTLAATSGGAIFVQTDLITKGNWKSVYGSEGYGVFENAAAYPKYLQLGTGTFSTYVWAASTTDPRGLQKATSSAERIASCWYADTSFSVDLNFTDGQIHQVAFYFLDWDSTGRSAKVQILDTNNLVLDTQILESFTNGVYLVWKLSGRVKLQVTNVGGGNAVMSGMFFGTGAAGVSTFSSLSGAAGVSSFRLSCNASSLSGGDSTECSVELPQVPAAGATVILAADNPRLRVPPSVAVPQGNASATFRVDSGISDQEETGTIRAVVADAVQAATIVLRGTRPASLKCSPKSVPAGQRARCELQLNSVPATDVVSIALSSSSRDLKLPATVTTRPGQSSLSFEILADPAAKQQTAGIQATYGTHTVEENVEFSPAAAPVLRAPHRLIAKFGDVVRFAVTASDAGGSVSLLASGLPAGATWDAATGEFLWTPDQAQAGKHVAVFTATNAAGVSTTGRIRIEVGSGKPVVNALVNAATGSQDAACSPGSVASLHGSWLFMGQQAADPSGSSIDLTGTRVRVNGTVAPVLYANPARVDFLCPQSAAGTLLEVSLETETGMSDAVKTVMQAASPGIFSLDGSGLGQGLVSFGGTAAMAAVRDFRNAGQPAQPGDVLSIRATGLGSMESLSTIKPIVKIGGMPVQADDVDTTGFAGVLEIRVKLPAGVPTGRDIPLSLELPGREGAASNTVSIAIEAARF
jgi:uncharacterized protein (TIGR03437 family)